MSENFGSAKPHAKNRILLNLRSVIVWYGDSVSMLFEGGGVSQGTHHCQYDVTAIFKMAPKVLNGKSVNRVDFLLHYIIFLLVL